MTDSERSGRASASDSGPLRAGDLIGPYRVEGPLGKGGMGEVVAAYDHRLDRRVAIKRIRHDSETTADDRERLRREARAAAGLNHPAIVQIHDILSEADGDAIVMELVEGRSVAECLEAGPLALDEAVRLARQIAEGLAEAHRIGLVHRDLKAENVMVTPASSDHPGRAKILDFGLVKVLHRPPSGGTLSGRDVDQTLTRQGAVLGTVRAMSPEQAEGGEVDHRSDLFSFGVLLYEMLTGRSPFRGANALETFRRLLVETPRPVRELRPAVPAELESLIARLLAKQPGKRLGDAGEVARQLADLADRMLAALPASSDGDSLSDVPTGSFVAAKPLASAEDPPSLDSNESSALAPFARRRWWVAVAGLVLLAVLAGVFLRGRTGRSAPLRVVVPRPEIVSAEPSPELDLVASGVLIAALGTLADLEGLAPIEPSEIRQTPGSMIDIAREVAADEVLAVRIERRDGSARIFLRRVRGVDGEILWAKAFRVPLRVSTARRVAEAVAMQVQSAFPGNRLRHDVAKLMVSEADYEELVRVAQRVDSGQVPMAPELVRLEAMVGREPRFLAAYRLAASVALTLHGDTRDPAYLERAERLIQRARSLAPRDVKVIGLEFRAALAGGDREAADKVLADLVEAAPNSIEVDLARFRLAKQKGDLASAQEAMELAVERRPSWGNLYRLADLESLRGDVEGARRHLEEMIRRAPANTRGLAKLAQLELRYGDLESAEDLLLRAIEIRPHRSYLTNLGLTRFLLGRYPQAKASYLQALELEPDNLTVQLNLADTELALGEQTEARSWYQKVESELERRDHEGTESMTLAQCLARLGDSTGAVAVTLETLQRHPDHSEVVYQAALVYALVGETASALVNVEKALGKGVKPRWFRIPGFKALADDPRFQSLLDDDRQSAG